MCDKMRKFFLRESKVENYSKEHVELVFKTVHKLKELMSYFYENEYEIIATKVREISKIEHDADEIRRMMEIEFYKGAFLPFDREDRIIMAELVDNVADMTQEVAYEIYLSKINFPPSYKEDFSNFMDAIIDAVSVLKECVELLNVDLGLSISKAHEVEQMEDLADVIEHKIIERIYESYKNKQIDILTLIELKDVTKKLGNIVDRAEDASDRVLIIVSKRRG
jgi:uncharacterized protein